MASMVWRDVGDLVAVRQWKSKGGQGIPWVLNLGDHNEIAGNAVTPTSNLFENEARYESARRLGGVFCAATHYWELSVRAFLLIRVQ